MKGPGLRRFAEGIALALPLVVVSSPFLLTSRCLYGREFQAYFRSHALYAQEMTARDGEWPLWYGRQYAGTPYLGDGQGSLHYPPNLLFLIAAPERVYGLLFVLHMAAAAIGMHRLCRYLGLRPSAGVVAGVAYSLSLSVTLKMAAGLLNPFVTQALAPWVLLLSLRVLKRPTCFRIALLSMTIGGVLVGGGPKDFSPLIVLSLGLALWNTIGARRRGRPWKLSLASLGTAGLFGGMLGSISLLPALEVARYAVWDSFTSAPVLTERLKELHIGALPLCLAAAALRFPRRGPVLFCAISGAVAIGLGLGAPGLPLRCLWVGTLCLSLLAACGWDALRRGGAAPFGLAWAPAAAFVLTAAELCAWNLASVSTRTQEEYSSRPWYESVIGGEREDYRLLDLTSADAGPAAYGFRLLNGYDYPRLASLPSSSDRLEDLNVRWLISTMAPPTDRWKRIAVHGGKILYENRRSRRGAYITPEWERMAAPLAIRRTANVIEVSGRSYRAEQLTVSESWMPGWRAYMERRKVPVLRMQEYLLGVDVPAGDWFVTFRYDPGVYRIGRLLASSALAALCGLLIAGIRRSKVAVS